MAERPVSPFGPAWDAAYTRFRHEVGAEAALLLDEGYDPDAALKAAQITVRRRRATVTMTRRAKLGNLLTFTPAKQDPA